MMSSLLQTPFMQRYLANEFLVSEYLSISGILLHNVRSIAPVLQTKHLPAANELEAIFERHDYNQLMAQISYLQAEIILVRSVANFQVYLTDMLRSYLRNYPDVLGDIHRDGDPPRFTGIGEVSDPYLELAAFKKAESLLSQKFVKVVEFLTERIELELDVSHLVPEVQRAINVRNIITHNRGRINPRFQERSGSDNLTLDAPLITSLHSALEQTKVLKEFAQQIDQAMVTKHGIDIFMEYISYPTLTEGVSVKFQGSQIQYDFLNRPGSSRTDPRTPMENT